MTMEWESKKVENAITHRLLLDAEFHRFFQLAEIDEEAFRTRFFPLPRFSGRLIVRHAGRCNSSVNDRVVH